MTRPPRTALDDVEDLVDAIRDLGRILWHEAIVPPVERLLDRIVRWLP